jgi:hydrogenase maturation protease
MSPALLIGCGNPLRGDDGVGPAVVAACAEKMRDVETIVVLQLTPELAEPISRAPLVIFVDAGIEEPAGAIRVRALTARADVEAPVSHHLTPTVLLELAAGLYEGCPPAFLVTIGGGRFGMEEGLSRDVGEAIPAAVEKIQSLVSCQVVTSQPSPLSP